MWVRRSGRHGPNRSEYGWQGLTQYSPRTRSPLKTLLHSLGTRALDLLFPPLCLTCGAVAEAFCPACRSEIRPAEEDEPLPREVSGAGSVGYYEGPLRQAVLRLKFEQKVALARPLGGLLAERLGDEAPLWKPDGLVPVPIHWRRMLERGFNQSELLAQQAGKRARLPVVGALRRMQATPAQVGLSAQQRSQNLVGAIAVAPGWPVQGRRLVLIDDVRTTGSTLAVCAAALRAAGADEVFALTVCYDRKWD